MLALTQRRAWPLPLEFYGEALWRRSRQLETATQLIRRKSSWQWAITGGNGEILSKLSVSEGFFYQSVSLCPFLSATGEL